MKVCPGYIAALLATIFSLPALCAQQPSAADQGQPGSQNSATVTAQSPSDADDAPQAASSVRIIRLSQVRGQVRIDRNAGAGFEPAFANIPVTSGAKLRTGDGLAEIEFEDNSTVRLAPETEVDFPELSRTSTGGTINKLDIVRGTVYASLAKTQANSFTLTAASATLVLQPSSHMRLTLAGPKSNLAVFDGTVQLSTALGTVAVTKKKSLDFDASSAAQPAFAKLEKAQFDEWDKNQTDYEKHYASAAATGGSGFLYGSSDLDYYGSFADLPGCGMMWRPYFASAAWDPYGNGVWAWYPGAGYSWVSPYPWGWLPFHLGEWQMCGAGGWGWRPSGTWRGLHNWPVHRPLPPRPPQRPGPGVRPTMVVSNTRPLVFSRPVNGETFAFRKDSAGLGVPRETFGKLGKTSTSVEHHGFANAPIQMGYIGRNARGAAAGPAGSPGNPRSAEAYTGSRSTQVMTRANGAERTGAASSGWSGSHSGGWSGASSSGGAASSHMSAPSAPSAPAAAPAASAGAASHK